MAVPNYVTDVGESGDLIQPPMSTTFGGGALPPMMPPAPPSLPVTPATSAPNATPIPLGTPQQKPNKLAELLKVILPAVTGVMAARQGGPGAAAALLKSYSDELSVQRQQAEARHKLDIIEARDESDRQDRTFKYQTEQRQKLATFENTIASQLAKLDDPTEYAEVLRHADEASATAYGTPIGYFSTRYALTPSAKDTKLAKSALASLPKTIQEGLESGQLDATQVRLSSGPMAGKTVREVQTLAGAASVQTAQGGPVQVPKPDTAREDESAFITREVQIDTKKKGAPLDPAEHNAAAKRGREMWALAGNSAGGGSSDPGLSVTPDTIQFFSQAALSGVKVNDLIPSFGMGQAAVKAKSKFLDGIANQANTLGIDGHTFGAMLVDSRAKQAAYTNAQKIGTQTRINETNAKNNLTQLVELSEKLDQRRFQTSIPILNDWIRTGVVHLSGDPDVNNFLSILTETLTEYAKVVSGQTTGAGVTVHANQQAQSLVNRGLNSGTIKSFKTQAERAMHNRISSFDDALKGLFGNIQSLQQRREGGLGEDAVPPAVRDALANMPDSAPGESYKAPDGTQWVKKAGVLTKVGG